MWVFPYKANLLKYISNTYINLYRLDDIYDYFYGEMPYSTKDIDEFKLTYIRDNGFVLSYPDIYNPEITLSYKHHEKLFDKFEKTKKEKIEITTTENNKKKGRKPKNAK